jgi:hypothetical protein
MGRARCTYKSHSFLGCFNGVNEEGSTLQRDADEGKAATLVNGFYLYPTCSNLNASSAEIGNLLSDKPVA